LESEELVGHRVWRGGLHPYARGKTESGGECGIRKDASYPVIKAEAQPIVDSFQEFKQKFKRVYRSVLEEEYRRKVFTENMDLVAVENAKGKSYKLGVTDFADITFDEFKKTYLTGFTPQKTNRNLGTFQAPADFVEPADGVDWTTKGAVTPVKNQGHCGSCWAFSTTGALEGAAVIAGRKLVSLSEENILDGDKGGNKCQGGSMEQAFGWVEANGLCSEATDSYMRGREFR